MNRMNDLISRAEAIELKPEFLNPNVNRETKEQTAIDRAYARGWNSCNTHWIKEIIEDLPSAQPERLTDYSFEESCTDCPAYDTENHRCPRFNQVIRMALKDANLEACEDCISRQEAIDALDKRFDNVPMEQTAEILKLRKDLRELPSIQSKQKRGKWIYGEDEYGIDGYHCDKCGFFVPWDYTHKFINYIEDYNFCPSCGADMRGEQDGRDD